MNKWTDKTGAGYRLPGDRVARHVTVDAGTTLDLAGAAGGEIGSVSGAGGVRVPSLAALPQIIGGIGELEVTGGDCAFTVSQQSGVDVVSPAVAVTGALTLPPACTIRVTFDGRPSAKRIPLLTYGTLTAPGLNEWTLETAGDVPPGATLRLVRNAHTVDLEILASGTLFLLH